MLDSLHIKSVATYNNTGVAINNLQPINFFYGANGCGKTTISNYLKDTTNGLYSDCTIKWHGDAELDVIVYNKKFREDNFEKETIDGVFTLGKATKEEKEAITKLAKERDLILEQGKKTKETLGKQKGELETLENDFKESIWNSVLIPHKTDFKEAFKGLLSNKQSFVEKVLATEVKPDGLETLESLRERAKTIFGEEPIRLDEISIPQNTRLKEIENNLIWKKKIIGKQDVPIASLIQHLGNNDWVNEGRKFLNKEDDICPFCQEKTINEDLRKNIADFFDKGFVEDSKQLQTFELQYLQESQNTVNLLMAIVENEKGKKESKLDPSHIEALVNTLESRIDTNNLTVKAKLKEPSREFEIQETESQINLISEVIQAHNLAIKEHNKIVDNFTEEKKKLTSDIWNTVLGMQYEAIEKFKTAQKAKIKAIGGIQKKRDTLLDKYTGLVSEVKEANKNVTSVQPAVDEINKLLKAYSFDSFEIVPSDTIKNSYCVCRPNGEIATDTLSEGEVTFITFLYYLQRANGGSSEADIKNARVLVIDDPISSLDSNVIYVVSSLIKGILKNVRKEQGDIKQVILLTHNVFFHKEVSFVDGRSKGCNKTHFWIIRKSKNISSVTSHEKLNPIETAYELLWREVKEHIKSPTISSLSLQNTLRRILENYFKILGKMGDDDLINAFDSPEEKQVCRSLLCWVNDGSHTIPDDLHVQHADDSKERYLNVFQKIFQYTNNQGHYDMMIK